MGINVEARNVQQQDSSKDKNGSNPCSEQMKDSSNESSPEIERRQPHKISLFKNKRYSHFRNYHNLYNMTKENDKNDEDQQDHDESEDVERKEEEKDEMKNFDKIEIKEEEDEIKKLIKLGSNDS